MTNHEIAKDVLSLVGGESNVISVVHCATRLRFKLKDETIAEKDILRNHPCVLKVVQAAGLFQVVVGSRADEVFEALMELGDFTSKPVTEPEIQSVKKHQNPFNIFIDVTSSIFTPFLGVLAGTAFMKGMLNLLVFTEILNYDSGVFTILNAAADGFLHFLPIAIAFTAAKKFKTNEFLAVALAMALVYPGVSTYNDLHGEIFFLHLPVIYGAGYASSILPIIIAVYIQSFIEPFMKKISPKIFRIFLPTMLTLLIMTPLTFIFIGPLGTIIGVFLGKLFEFAYEFNPLIAGLILGGLWQVIVLFGMHWGLVPIALSHLGTNGFDFLLPIAVASVIAQSGSAFGVFLKAKSSKLKGLASSATITGIFGITEPAIYGITLPLKKPFIAGCIGGAIGGAINAMSGVYSFAFSTSILIIPNLISTKEGIESNFRMGIVGFIVAFTFSAILTLILGFEEKK